MKETMNTPGSRHTVSVPKQTSTSNIPLRRQLSKPSSIPSNGTARALSDPAHRWKQKYEDSEERRKVLLTEKEKALRSIKDLEKKHLNLQVKHEHLETELFEKNEEFTKLSTASKNLYKEYETLKNQYETETGAMARALKDASQWYKENKELKRRTFLLPDKDAVDEGVDTGENGGDADIENLNKTIKQLSTEVAELQTELDSVRQSEFHAQEQNAKISEELEIEKANNKQLRSDLDKLQVDYAQLVRVSEVLKKEMEKLKEIEEQQRIDLEEMRKEAAGCRKERNVLAHQSTLLLQGLNEDNATESLFLLQEIESLKSTIEDERNRYEEEIMQLQEKLEDKEESSHVEIMEERLKLVESELQAAIARAEAAEEKLKAPPMAPPMPPPPPPPPPPAPPMMSDKPPVVPLRRRKSRATVQELAETIGVQDITPADKPAPPGVNDDIINAIKEGKFTLKKAKKDKESNKQEKDTPKAVSELLNILGSLRRAPKKRQSILSNKEDVVDL